MDDKQGKWVTINGVHIFLKKGQTVEQAFAELGVKQDKAIDDMVNAVSYVQLSPWIHHYYDDDFKHRVAPKKHAQRVFRDALDTKANNDDDEIVIKTLKNKVDEFILKDSYGSQLKWTTTWDKGRIIRLHLSINGTRMLMCNYFYHEIGHAIDMYEWGRHSSNDYKSKKYDATMGDMLLNEFADPSNIELIRDEFEYLKSKKQSLWEDIDRGALDKKEGSKVCDNISEAQTSLIDMMQAVYGDKQCKEVFGGLGHDEGYFDKNRKFRSATECFAELTASRNCDKDKHFYNIMKQYCPKTVEIYEEIMEGKKNGTIN